jgi:hypothetical protein
VEGTDTGFLLGEERGEALAELLEEFVASVRDGSRK